MRTTQEAEVVKIKCKLFYFSKIFDFYHSDIFAIHTLVFILLNMNHFTHTTPTT